MKSIQLDRQIQELLSAQLIREDSADQFAFRHTLIHDVAYGSLLQRERRTYHRLVAETIERIYANTLEGFVGDLALHYFQAEAWEKALEYSRRAGEDAQRTYSEQEAVIHFNRAIEAGRKLPAGVAPSLHRARGRSYEILGEFENARADDESALELARRNDDALEEWQALLDLGFLWASRDYDRTGVYFEKALVLARSVGDSALLGRTLNRVGNWHDNREEPRKGETYHREALAIFEAAGDKPGLAETADFLSFTSELSGNWSEFLTYTERAVALFRELGDRRGLVSSLAGVAASVAHFSRNMWGWNRLSPQDALAASEEALRISREIGWRSGEAFALGNHGAVLGVSGDYGRGLDEAHQALFLAEEIEHTQWIVLGCMNLGVLYSDLLASDEALRYFERAAALAGEIRSGYFERLIASLISSEHVRSGNKERLGLAEKVLDSVLGPDFEINTAGQWVCWKTRAELALARGEAAKALDWIENLIAWSVGTTPGPDLSRLRTETLIQLGRLEQAQAVLLQADSPNTPSTQRWELKVTLGKIYGLRGQSEAAQAENFKARALIGELAQNTPDEGLARNFKTRALARISNEVLT